MQDYLKEALDIVKAQAGVRTMTEDELASMLQKLTRDIRSIGDSLPLEGFEGMSAETSTGSGVDASKAVREKSIICAECGRSFKLLSRKHLASHGLTPEEYREKYGYKKGASLACKSLQRERRKKMREMKLWERRARPAAKAKKQTAKAAS
ncbi:MAG: MucR family transcriptional regulator [Deltaproteobacteria bacterium]|jgi:predicted transcriptional regulator|nr:MucR family transcriptional regulator [Deltaproteobacteria bacterium]